MSEVEGGGSFSGLVAESHTQPYSNSSDPWTFSGDSPELTAQIETTVARFEPLAEGFVGQFSRYFEALQHNTDLPVTLRDARDALELITAIYYSAETGRAVELPIGEDHPRYAGWQP